MAVGIRHPRYGQLTTRFQKAKVISEAEARYIVDHATEASSGCVVIQHWDQWFDVRRMTEKEIEHLIDDLDRARSAELAAGVIHPH